MISCDGAYDQSWHPNTDGTINRGMPRSIERSIVASCDRSFDQSLLPTTDRTIIRGAKRFGIADYKVLNMTIDLFATDLSLAITHDLCDQSYVLSTICLRFQIVLVAATSQPGRRPGVTGFEHTYNLAATDFALVFTHDLYDHSYVLSTICLRFQHFSVAGRS